MTAHNIDLLISKYLSDQASEEELSALEEWAQQSPQNAKTLQAFQAIKTAKLRESKLIFADRSFEKIESKVQHKGRRGITTKRSNRRLYWMRIAAGFVLLALIAWSVNHFIDTSTPDGVHQTKYISKSNPSGQKSMIYLPDGSTLWLNAQSSIRYEKNFNDSTRIVHLVGEAYFIVKKDTLKPFVVQAGNTLVTALGTTFNVEAFGEDDHISVALESGRVKVQQQDHKMHGGVVLHAGELARVPVSGNQIQVSNFDPMHTLAWKDGIIYFKDAQFDEVIQTLERWYGVKFQYEKPPSLTWHFSGTFRNENLENVLHTLSYGEQLQFKIHGDTVQLNLK